MLARKHLINLWDSRWDFNDDGFNEVRTHAKYVLVKGTVGKDRRAYRVWTGSQNWVAGSLSRSDETTLNIGAAVGVRELPEELGHDPRPLPAAAVRRLRPLTGDSDLRRHR